MTWLNRRDVAAARVGAGALAACVAIAAIQLLSFAAVAHARIAVHDWLLFVPIPGLVMFAASRVGIFKDRPWLLLPFGLLAFVVAVVTVTATHNILFATAILAKNPNAPRGAPLRSGPAR